MIGEHSDLEEDNTREMYARYGLAIYLAQTVEANLKSALSVAELGDSRFQTLEDFDTYAATNFKTVLGRLIEKFKPFLSTDQQFADDLQLALLTRNQLAHHFFWDHALRLMTYRGREHIIQECDIAIELFEGLATRLEGIVRAYLERIPNEDGVEERLSSAHRKVINRANLHGVHSCARCHARMEARKTSMREYYVCSNCGSLALLR